MAGSVGKIACRNLVQIVRKTAAVTAARSYSDSAYVEPHRGKSVSERSMPDTLGHAVGPERYELLANLAGNEDPFQMKVKKRANGTVDDPTLIPSFNEKRVVGCICEEDALSIQWMWLHRGEPKRCMCGNWFKLVDKENVDYGQQ